MNEMKRRQQAPTYFLGSSIVQLVYVEVTPLVVVSESQQQSPPSLSNFGIKYLLQKQTRVASLSNDSEKTRIEWRNPSNCGKALSSGYLFQDESLHYHHSSRATFDFENEEESTTYSSFPILYLPSDDPSVLHLQPCCVVAYARSRRNVQHIAEVAVTPATLVRVLPPRLAHFCNNNDGKITARMAPRNPPSWYAQEEFLQLLSGELGTDFLSDTTMQTEIFRNHNTETVQELSLRFSLLLSQHVKIGTTGDAFSLQKEATTRQCWMKQAIQSHCEAKNIALRPENLPSSTQMQQRSVLQWEPSLIIHSPNHADGKTLLAQALAVRVGCSSVHLIRPGTLLARYGISADAALESLLHAIAVSAAAQEKSVCIILDHLDAMMPPRLSGRSSSGDAAAPIFNAIASYLGNLTGSLQRLQQCPFPLKNPLYNLSGAGGRVLSVRLCLIGIVTCPDDGWRSSQTQAGISSTILDSMVGGRYRIPSLTAKTRLSAFSGAFEREQLQLDDSAIARLPVAAASAAWAKGSAFSRVASKLREIVGEKGVSGTQATSGDLERAVVYIKNNSSDFAQVSFQAQDSSPSSRSLSSSLFESVGGNVEAKISLEDALALAPNKRRMLARFGLSPPTGILLYGPPGCGKTLLAKAVAKLLKAPGQGGDSLTLGGTFMSLSSSDIVRAEIGTSEKIIISAFEFADKNAPAVVFLDEFQALFTERSRGGSGKLATTLLQCLDDIKRWRELDRSAQEDRGATDGNSRLETEGNRVIVMGATNTPWMIDSAFLRPGRFDRVVHVGLPTETERQAILLVHAKCMRIRDREHPLVLEMLCKQIAERSDGFSGADLAALCRSAAIRALLDVGETGDIKENHFLEALDKDVKASSDDTLVGRLLTWRP